MKDTPFWIIVIIVVGFLGFMMGYAVPPFMEVGFGQREAVMEEGSPGDEEMMKEYQELYREEEQSPQGGE